MRSFLLRLALSAALLAPAASALGQAPATAPVAPATPPTTAPSSEEAAPPEVSAATKAARARLDALKLDLDQKDAALSRRDLSDADLQRLRQETEPVAQELARVIGRLQPRLDAARAQLAELGPRPKEDAAPESADVQRERAAREAAVAELDETQRLARALAVHAEQITTRVSDRRRSAFTRALIRRTSGILSPDLWSSVWASLPRDWTALKLLFGSWWDRIEDRATPGILVLLGLAVGAAIALYAGRRYIAPRVIHRDPAAEPSRMNRLLAALAVLAVGALPAAGGSWLVYAALDVTGMLPPRIDRVVAAFLGGLAFVALARALAEAILAPGRAGWRLVRLGDRPAERTATFVVAIAAIIATGKFLEAQNQAIAAPLPLSVATKGLFALFAALALAELLRRFAASGGVEEECFGPYIPTETDVGWPVRVLGWSAVAAVIASVLLGYIAFASFLIDQLVWIALILSTLLLAWAFGDEFTTGALGGETRVSTILQANTGLRRRSIQQVGILANGVARVVLIVAAVMLALAPWGVDSADLLGSVRAAFFGFKVGEVTISLATLAIALLIFGLGFAVTRVVQNWLENTFLPATDLDAGLRNSIRTAFGYLGFFAAAALAFSYLGLSLDKIAIVAGALSVGIGFGLQSIVNNFVSGLILLWERPIRVGDLVVVGDGEGHVRRISVRATEIETFDRATIIVPNSNLISGVVKNRVRVDRTGRVVIAINVLRNQDPARAAEILSECAADHPDVLKNPPPRVSFKKIGDTWLEFELVAYVTDVNLQQRVQSDLNFALFRCLSAEKIMPPLGPGVMSVQGLEPVRDALDHIAGAIAGAERKTQPASSS
jgi:small-conductance mechanosensitive channel